MLVLDALFDHIRQISSNIEIMGSLVRFAQFRQLISELGQSRTDFARMTALGGRAKRTFGATPMSAKRHYRAHAVQQSPARRCISPCPRCPEKYDRRLSPARTRPSGEILAVDISRAAPL
jgi:hypothetical protein